MFELFGSSWNACISVFSVVVIKYMVHNNIRKLKPTYAIAAPKIYTIAPKHY